MTRRTAWIAIALFAVVFVVLLNKFPVALFVFSGSFLLLSVFALSCDVIKLCRRYGGA